MTALDPVHVKGGVVAQQSSHVAQQSSQICVFMPSNHCMVLVSIRNLSKQCS